MALPTLDLANAFEHFPSFAQELYCIVSMHWIHGLPSTPNSKFLIKKNYKAVRIKVIKAVFKLKEKHLFNNKKLDIRDHIKGSCFKGSLFSRGFNGKSWLFCISRLL